MFANKIVTIISEFIICMFLTIILSCTVKDTKKESTYQNYSTKTVTVTSSLYDDVLESFGTVTYKLKNDVTTTVAGTLEAFSLKEGAAVKKGQIIAELKNVQLEIQKDEYISSLDSAKAALDLAKAELQEDILAAESKLLSIDKSRLAIRQKELELELENKTLEHQKELHTLGGVTDYSIEQAKLNLSASKTNIDILKKELEISILGFREKDLRDNGVQPSSDKEIQKKQIIDLNTKRTKAKVEQAEAGVRACMKQIEAVNILIDKLHIKSPVEGILGIKYYENGEYIAENQKLATIIDTSSVYVVISIQEKDMVNFTKGTKVTMHIPSLRTHLSSSITEMSPIADPQSGNFSVKVEIENKNNVIKPGMFVQCRIERSEPLYFLCIPESALLESNQKKAKVFCVVNGYAVLKEIEIKNQRDGQVWIESGLVQGEIVVDTPSPFLKEGMKVDSI